MSSRLFCVLFAAGVALAADPQLLNLLPPDSKVLGGIDFAESRNTPFGDYLLGKLEQHAAEIDRFAAETGIDPRNGLISMAMGGTGMGRESDGVATFRGNFQRDSLVQYASSKGAQVLTYAGAPMIVGRHERSPALGFPLPDVGIFGSRERVQAALERWQAAIPLNAEVRAKADAVSAGKHGWFLLLGSPAELAGRLPQNSMGGAMRGDLIKAIEEMSGTILFGQEVEMEGQILAADAESAKALANVIQFFVSFAQLGGDVETAAIVARFFANMQLTTSGNRVNVTLRVAEADFEAALERFHSHGRHGVGNNGNRSGGEGRRGRPSRSGAGR